MLGNTHATGGMAVALWASILTGHVEHVPLFLYPMAATAALGPDADQAQATASKDPFWKIVRTLLLFDFFKIAHRGPTHTLLALGILTGAVALLIGHFPALSVAIGGMVGVFILSQGYASHLYLDMLNAMGAPLLAPLTDFYFTWYNLPYFLVMTVWGLIKFFAACLGIIGRSTYWNNVKFQFRMILPRYTENKVGFHTGGAWEMMTHILCWVAIVAGVVLYFEELAARAVVDGNMLSQHPWFTTISLFSVVMGWMTLQYLRTGRSQTLGYKVSLGITFIVLATSVVMHPKEFWNNLNTVRQETETTTAPLFDKAGAAAASITSSSGDWLKRTQELMNEQNLKASAADAATSTAQAAATTAASTVKEAASSGFVQKILDYLKLHVSN